MGFMRTETGVGRGRSQVALLRFAERRSGRRCSEPPRNATEGIVLDVACQFKAASSLVALEKTDLCSKPVAAPKVAASLPAKLQVVVASGSWVALLPATLGELFRSASS